MTGVLEVPVRVGRDEARRRAAEELSKLRYGVELPDWLRRLLQRLWDFVTNVLPTAPESGPRSSGPVALVVVVLVLLALVVLVWRVGLPRLNRRRSDGEVGAQREVSARRYRSLAEAAAARGDWRTAVRERFRSVVRELETRTVLTPRPSRTALETAWTAGRMVPSARAALFDSAGVFGEVEYGDTAATEEHYRRLTRAETEILAAADRADLDAYDEVGV